MDSVWNETEYFDWFPFDEEINRVFYGGVNNVSPTAGGLIDLFLEAIYKRPQGKIPVLIPKDEPGWNRFDILALDLFGVWGEEFCKNNAHDIKDGQHDAPQDRSAVFLELPPHQSPVTLADLFIFNLIFDNARVVV